MQGLRLGGHPLHPALVHFPVVCWTATPCLYGVYLLRRDLAFWHYAFWCNGLGVAMAVLAMGAGFMDLLAIPAEHPAQVTGQRHMLLMASAWCIYTLVLVACPIGVAPSNTRAWLGLGLSLAGLALLGIGVYAGARLVYDFGIGQTGKSRKTALP
jgi:uncharacterized membrane protein